MMLVGLPFQPSIKMHCRIYPTMLEKKVKYSSFEMSSQEIELKVLQRWDCLVCGQRD